MPEPWPKVPVVYSPEMAGTNQSDNVFWGRSDITITLSGEKTGI